MKHESVLPCQLLKSATQKSHLVTEQLMGLSKNGGAVFTGAKFLQLSQTNYSVWSAFKEELQLQEPGWWSNYWSLIDKLVEAALLDLVGKQERSDASHVAYPAITDEYSLVGSLYVHLGSLLGGHVIQGMLERNKELLPFQPFNFYAAGASFTGREWRSFITRLNAALINPGHLAAAVTQADEVFSYYQRVYLEFGPFEVNC